MGHLAKRVGPGMPGGGITPLDQTKAGMGGRFLEALKKIL